MTGLIIKAERGGFSLQLEGRPDTLTKFRGPIGGCARAEQLDNYGVRWTFETSAATGGTAVYFDAEGNDDIYELVGAVLAAEKIEINALAFGVSPVRTQLEDAVAEAAAHGGVNLSEARPWLLAGYYLVTELQLCVYNPKGRDELLDELVRCYKTGRLSNTNDEFDYALMAVSAAEIKHLPIDYSLGDERRDILLSIVKEKDPRVQRGLFDLIEEFDTPETFNTFRSVLEEI